MSEGGTNVIETKVETMSKKLNFISRHVKEILEKLNEKTHVVNTGKGHGKPSGSSFEEKQKSFMGTPNGKRIREPKPKTPQYYKIKLDRESGNYVYF